MSDNDPPKNPFIRWKQLVDAHIGMTLNGLLGIPAMVNKNMSLQGGESGRELGRPATATEDDALDGVDANQLLEWHKFIYYSPYSPLQLQQQQHLRLLPAPVPQDTPFGADPYSFTYADAFEDLLRASSGRPLLDLADRSFRNLRYLMRSGSAVESPHVFFHRMHSQGLLDAYFPRTTAGVAAVAKTSSDNADGLDETANDRVVRAVTLAEGAEAEAAQEHNDRNDDDYHDQKENESEAGKYDAWAYHDAEQQKRHRAGLGGGSLFDELDRVFRVLGRIIDEDTGVDVAKRDKKDKRENDAQPNAEDELYEAVRSAYSNAEKSLSTLIKTFTGSSSINSSSSSDKPLETKTSTEEHTDMFGNRHVKTVIRRVDADGNEVARETRYTVRSPTAQELAIQEADDASDGPQQQPEDKELEPVKRDASEQKPSGWFWK